jgi:hypothetical protein
VKRQIKTISAAVLRDGMDKQSRTVDKGTAAVLYQGFNTLLRCIEVQRKLDKQAELDEQVRELSERLEQVKAVRYGRSS